MPTFRTLHNVSYRAIVLTMFMAASVTGCQLSEGAANPGGQPAGPAIAGAGASVAPASLGDPAVRLIVDDLRAAKERHDLRAFHQFRNQLTERLGAAAIKDADAAYRQVLANLIAAEAFHDGLARVRYRTQLRALCDPAGITGAIEFCETDIATYAD